MFAARHFDKHSSSQQILWFLFPRLSQSQSQMKNLNTALSRGTILLILIITSQNIMSICLPSRNVRIVPPSRLIYYVPSKESSANFFCGGPDFETRLPSIPLLSLIYLSTRLKIFTILLLVDGWQLWFFHGCEGFIGRHCLEFLVSFFIFFLCEWRFMIFLKWLSSLALCRCVRDRTFLDCPCVSTKWAVAGATGDFYRLFALIYVMCFFQLNKNKFHFSRKSILLITFCDVFPQRVSCSVTCALTLNGSFSLISSAPFVK